MSAKLSVQGSNDILRNLSTLGLMKSVVRRRGGESKEIEEK